LKFEEQQLTSFAGLIVFQKGPSLFCVDRFGVKL
jgi:hypothetical protein